MKHLLSLCILIATICSCTRNEQILQQDAVPGKIIELLKRAGFSTENIQKLPEGYLVEKDLLLTEELLNNMQRQHMIIAQEEHYRTTNLVTGLPRTISIRLASGFPASASTALDNVIAAYNGLNLRLRFQRVTTGGQIVIIPTNGIPYLATSGFPSGGNPFPTIRITVSSFTQAVNTMSRIIAHEIGHCIGFRHTDFASAASSCSGVFIPEPSGVGAIYIPGTPTGPEPASWMMRCINPAFTTLFSPNDRVALNYVY